MHLNLFNVKYLINIPFLKKKKNFDFKQKNFDLKKKEI